VFVRHIEAVKRGLPPERLLVCEIAEGWAPLCRFLERPVPDAPFPRVNATAEFRRRFHD
jgi:sulfotransferase family protein